LLQRVLRGGFIAETGLLIASEDDRRARSRLAARPDLERGRTTSASARVSRSRPYALGLGRAAGDIGRPFLLPGDIGRQILDDDPVIEVYVPLK
jgi:hypothetical protein